MHHVAGALSDPNPIGWVLNIHGSCSSDSCLHRGAAAVSDRSTVLQVGPQSLFQLKMLVVVGPERLSGLVKGATEQ